MHHLQKNNKGLVPVLLTSLLIYLSHNFMTVNGFATNFSTTTRLNSVNDASSTTQTNQRKRTIILNTFKKPIKLLFQNKQKSATTTKTVSPPKRPQAGGIRGNDYGIANNSTIPTAYEVAQILGVQPTLPNATTKTWKRAWEFHKALLPILHKFDSCKPPDSSLNLACLWWKALVGNDKSSPVYDDGLSYDLLPSFFRLVVWRKFVGFYPRLHHSNVEMRTAFLDKAVRDVLSSIQEQKKKKNDTKIRLVSFGAGYDLRSIKFLQSGQVDEIFELDLPNVVEAKEKLLGPRRLLKRRPELVDKLSNNAIQLLPVDLNNVESVREILLNKVLQDHHHDGEDKGGANANDQQWHTIFLFEGVMIYLDDGVPSALLNVTSDVLKERNMEGSLCFADRLENVPGGSYDLGTKELNDNGWKLNYWLPKPGMARHMGYASLC